MRYLMVETEGASYRFNEKEERPFAAAIQRGEKFVALETMSGAVVHIVIDKVEAWYINTPEGREEMRKFNKAIDEEGEAFNKENKKPEWMDEK